MSLIGLSRRRRGKRGYLLLEVIVGGTLAATILGLSTLSLLQMRHQRTRATKALVAEQLLQERVAEVAAIGQAVVAADLPASPESITVSGLHFTRTTTITTGNTTWTVGAFTTGAVNYTDVEVSVEYMVPGTGLLLDDTTTMRLWAP